MGMAVGDEVAGNRECRFERGEFGERAGKVPQAAELFAVVVDDQHDLGGVVALACGVERRKDGSAVGCQQGDCSSPADGQLVGAAEPVAAKRWEGQLDKPVGVTGRHDRAAGTRPRRYLYSGLTRCVHVFDHPARPRWARGTDPATLALSSCRKPANEVRLSEPLRSRARSVEDGLGSRPAAMGTRDRSSGGLIETVVVGW